MGSQNKEENVKMVNSVVGEDDSNNMTSSSASVTRTLYRFPSKCPPVCFKSVPIWILFLLFLIFSAVLIVSIKLAEGNVSCKTCSNTNTPCNFTTIAEKSQQGYIADDIISTQQTELQELKDFFVQLSEPFCRFPFPKELSSNMKCFIPFKGEYVIDSHLDDGDHIKLICQPSINKHQYYLQCDDDVIDGCEVVCQNKLGQCSRLRFSVEYAAIILVSIQNSCGGHDGHFEIGSAEYYKSNKKRIFV